MDNKVSSKKIANNILEFLVDPSAFPLERRLYFRPEEILMNESFEKAKKESEQAYGDQRHNSDFYPNRPLLKREASSMERKTLIASLDVLSQEFIESDPMAKDLRTMAYAVANMSDEDFETRIAGNPWIEHMNKVRKDNPGKSFKEIASLAKKTFKKAEEEQPESKEAEEVPAEVPADDTWSKEASDAVQRALVAEVIGGVTEESEKKEAGKIKGPGKPDGTGPLGGTPECQLAEKEKEEKNKAAEEPEKKEVEKTGPGGHVPDATGPHGRGLGPGKGKADGSGLKEKEAAEEPEKKEATEEPEKKAEEEPKEAKEPTEVDTDVLKASHTEFGGIQLGAGMVTMDDIGDLSDEEQQRLGQLFK
jgi:hypothetical protein